MQYIYGDREVIFKISVEVSIVLWFCSVCIVEIVDVWLDEIVVDWIEVEDIEFVSVSISFNDVETVEEADVVRYLVNLSKYRKENINKCWS